MLILYKKNVTAIFIFDINTEVRDECFNNSMAGVFLARKQIGILFEASTEANVRIARY